MANVSLKYYEFLCALELQMLGKRKTLHILLENNDCAMVKYIYIYIHGTLTAISMFAFIYRILDK